MTQRSGESSYDHRKPSWLSKLEGVTHARKIAVDVLVLPLLHLSLFVGLILTPDGATGATFWQEFFPGPNNFFRSGLSFFGLMDLALLGALLLPPVCAFAATRPLLRRGGLTGLWISLPLLLVAGIFNALSLRILFFGFVASFILCLVLALRLPHLDEQDPADLPATGVSRMRGAGISIPLREEASLGWSPPLLALLGLLGYVPLFLSLPSPYIDTYDPYYEEVMGHGAHFVFTGWQLLGGGFQAPILLFTLIFAAFSYLVCLLSCV